LKGWKSASKKKYRNYPKWMAQKISLSFVCCTNPNCWFWRNPGFLSCKQSNIIKDEILLLREEGATIIFSTHRMERWKNYATISPWIFHKSMFRLKGNWMTLKDNSKPIAFEVGILSDKGRAWCMILAQNSPSISEFQIAY
jgi:ABC-2 type transport system ATP-binding protein